MASETKDCPGLMWRGADIPRIAPGDYQATCVGWQGPEWVYTFHRWSLRLEFAILDDGTAVSAFFNLGESRERPDMPGRRSRLYKAWCMANGELPRNGQQITWDTFTDERLLYLVRVEDAAKDGNGELKPGALIYSRVTEILKVERP